ncbi:cytochrome P450 [Infundibulicybe gibba]|nr:cytochrome P450 [Infundibulicybe gibba]
MQSSSILASIVLLSVSIIAIPLFRRRAKYPRGPRGLPLIGNLLQLTTEPWNVFHEWKKIYGPITYISLAGQPVIILNTPKAAADLLERRAAIYSDRPRNIVAAEIMTGGLSLPFLHHGDQWKSVRKAAHIALRQTSVEKFHTIQHREAILFIQGLLKNPEQWISHTHRTVASTITSMIYDLPPMMSPEDPLIKRLNTCVLRITHAASPGSHFVEHITWMKYLPSWIAGWKRRAESYFKEDLKMFTDLYEGTERRMESGEEATSFAATLLSTQDNHRLSKTQAAYLAGTMYATGFDTTSASLSWFIYLIAQHPEVQSKAHEELDRVVGRSRPPTFDDYENLPYICAIVREVLRLRPAAPLGLPHQSCKDDVYDGFFIPAGTLCFPNILSINRDEEAYGLDADLFNPSRHLDERLELRPGPADTRDSHVSFGFGKRVCVGHHVATNTLFINAAMTLWSSLYPFPLTPAVSHACRVRRSKLSAS